MKKNNTLNGRLIKTILILVLWNFVSIYAQPAQLWVNSYNGTSNGNDRAYRSAVDANGNIFVLGTTFNPQTKDDIVLIKYNSAGVQQWSKIYAGEVDGNDMPEDIVIDAQGNVFIAVYNQSSVGQNPYRIVVIKYNTSGTVVWTFTDTPLDSYKIPFCLTVANDGYIYAGGKFINGTTHQPYFVKINPNGIYSDAGYLPFSNDNTNYFSDIIADDFGNVYVTGVYKGKFITCKFNNTCDTVWTRKLSGTANGIDAGSKICFDNSFNVIVGGSVENTGISNDYCIIKYNNFGVQQWSRLYDGPPHSADYLSDMVIDDGGNIFVTGTSTGSGSGSDIATCRITAAGNLTWTNRYNGSGNTNDNAVNIALDNAGALYVGGTTNEGSDGTDYTVIKYSALFSNQHWLSKRSLSTGDTLTSMILDNNYNVIVSGYHKRFLNSDVDFGIFKLGSTIGIQSIAGEIPAAFELSQNYPNPFNPVTNIKIRMPKEGMVRLTVYDVTGKEAAQLVKENLKAGEYNVDFNASALPSGVYFYKLVTRDFSDVKKMILVK